MNLAPYMLLIVALQTPIQNGEQALERAKECMAEFGMQAPYRLQRLSPPPQSLERGWLVRLSDSVGVTLTFVLRESDGMLRDCRYANEYPPDYKFLPRKESLGEEALRDRAVKIAERFTMLEGIELADFRVGPKRAWRATFRPTFAGIQFIGNAPNTVVTVLGDGRVLEFSNSGSAVPRVNSTVAVVRPDRAKQLMESWMNQAVSRIKGERVEVSPVTRTSEPELAYLTTDINALAVLVWKASFSYSYSDPMRFRHVDTVLYVDAVTGEQVNPRVAY